MIKETLWMIKEKNEDLVKEVMTLAQVPYVIACLLVNRGITTKEAIKAYYNVSKESFHDPFLMLDMDIAVQKILQSRDHNNQIVIYGDYDVDGVTSTSILYMFLDEIGCNVSYYIPDRHEEGYGMNTQALELLKANGAQLVISVDTGITAIEQVKRCNEIGLEVIITDHHECQESLPAAIAVLNPKRPNNPYPFKMLAGVGVTFKLIQGIAQTIGLENKIWKYLDIVAVGTIADIVPIYGENRIITKLAFETMPTTWNEGLKALMRVADIDGKKMTAGRIGFGIGPRLNAAGRIKHAKEAVELFVCHDANQCNTIAEELNAVNVERQTLEKTIFKEAVNLIETTMKPEDKKIIVVASSAWHHGVIGIVASKLVEKYYRPVIILSISDGIASGSARSVEGFSIYDALYAQKELFEKFGGHEMAAGMSLKESNIEVLDKGLNDYGMIHMEDTTLIPKIKVDLPIDIEDISIDLIQEIQKMEPFGIGNPEPVFQCLGKVKTIKTIGKDSSHLRLDIGESHILQGIGFSMGEVTEWLQVGQMASCVGTLEINEWQNRKSPQLMIKDIKHENALYDGLKILIASHMQTNYILEADQIQSSHRPIKEDFTNFYRWLLQLQKLNQPYFYYTKVLGDYGISKVEALEKYFIILEVFSELGLIRYELLSRRVTFELILGKKVDLKDSKLYNRIL
jgi:single-stranded-DNA-specific exonuclease